MNKMKKFLILILSINMFLVCTNTFIVANAERPDRIDIENNQIIKEDKEKQEKEENKEKQEKEEKKNAFQPVDISGMGENKAIGKPETLKIPGQQTDSEVGDDLTVFGAGKMPADFSKASGRINNLFEWVKRITNIVLGLSIVAGIASMAILFVNLGIYSANPQKRADIIRKLIIVCIATALATSIGALFNFFVTRVFIGKEEAANWKDE